MFLSGKSGRDTFRVCRLIIKVFENKPDTINLNDIDQIE